LSDSDQRHAHFGITYEPWPRWRHLPPVLVMRRGGCWRITQRKVGGDRRPRRARSRLTFDARLALSPWALRQRSSPASMRLLFNRTLRVEHPAFASNARPLELQMTSLMYQRRDLCLQISRFQHRASRPPIEPDAAGGVKPTRDTPLALLEPNSQPPPKGPDRKKVRFSPSEVRNLEWPARLSQEVRPWHGTVLRDHPQRHRSAPNSPAEA